MNAKGVNLFKSVKICKWKEWISFFKCLLFVSSIFSNLDGKSDVHSLLQHWIHNGWLVPALCTWFVIEIGFIVTSDLFNLFSRVLFRIWTDFGVGQYHN